MLSQKVFTDCFAEVTMRPRPFLWTYVDILDPDPHTAGASEVTANVHVEAIT